MGHDGQQGRPRLGQDAAGGARRSAENNGGVLLAADRRRIEGARRRWARGEADTRAAVLAAHERDATVRELAEAAGVSKSTVHRWIRGQD
jgi:DNA-directed RNA polymerase specialized sigma24 family protein